MKKVDKASPSFHKQLADLDLKILAIVGGKDQKEVLEELAEASIDLLGGVFCLIQPYNQSTDQYLLDQFTTGGTQKAKSFEWTRPRHEGASRTTLRDGLLLIDDYENPKNYEKYPFLKEGVGAFKDVMNIKASLGIRLDADEEKVGVIFINYARKQKFTKEKIQLAQSFANRAAFAIKSARLYQESTSYASDLRKLLDIAERLTQLIKEPESVLLKSALVQTVELFNVTRGGIVFHEGQGGRLVASYDSRSTSEESDVGEVVFGDSSLQRLVRTSTEPIEIYDAERDERLGEEERGPFRELNVKSSLIIPLKARGRTIGSLGLDECKENRHFSQRERELARILAGFTAAAIDNVRLYSLAEDELTSLLRVAEDLVHRALEPGIVLDEFYNEVIRRTLELMQFDAGWLLLREGDWIRIVATDEQHKGDKERVFPIDGSISGLSILRKSLINVSDLNNMADEYKAVYQAPRGSQQMKSELVTPLIVRGEAIGAFNIESEKPNAFETRHEEMLRLINGYVGITIELARLRHETSALSSIGLELSRETVMEDVVKSVLNHSLRFVEGKFGQVLLRTDDKLSVSWTTNEPPVDLGNVVLENDSVSGLAIIEKKPILVPDVDKPDYFVVDLPGEVSRQSHLVHRRTEKPRYKRALEAEKERMQAEFAIPLFSNEDIIGVLNVETPDGSGFNRQQQEELLAYVRTTTDQFKQSLLQPVSHHETLKMLLRGALARINTAFGQILRLEGDELVIEQTTGGERIGTRVPVAKSVTGRAVKTMTPVYIPNVFDDPDYQRYLGEEMKSELVVPLMIGNNVVGVINIESPTLGFFTSDHARVLEPFASQAAVAIERARRFEQQALAEVGGLAGDIVHRLNNPLGAISMRMELLERQPFYNELLSKYPYLNQFIGRTAKDLSTAKDIIQALRVELRGKEPGLIDLLPIFHTALERAALPENISIESYIDDTIQVVANEKLVNVLWNLFDNARKAMPNGGNLIITALYDNHWVTVNVEDTGRGIEPWRVDLIFNPDESTTIDPNAPGHGLGLWWAKSQVERFGGTIAAESRLNEGTKITLRLRRGELLSK
jgi:GAF domain-containing protein